MASFEVEAKPGDEPPPPLGKMKSFSSFTPYYGEDVILVSHQDTLSLFTASLMGTKLTDHHVDWPMELGEVRCVDLSAAPSFGDGNFSPTDLRGEYAVGDKAVNYMR